MIIIPIGDHLGIGNPLKEEDIQVRVEGYPNEKDIPDRDGRPPGRGG